ncbi:hypothetical protein CTI12_AA158390 [Artemisia annua]|uniref:Pentatricopeptide repeat-containing protein n=1 Tax=Artemisia annua TaxID=35608 RepID=A0A2U1PEZ2_ARTAN|nr:hypothetical protein CTI12_AA158390 [Artemisia annua]
MAIRSLLKHLQQLSFHNSPTNRSSFLRGISSNTLSTFQDTEVDFRSKLLFLVNPKRSVMPVLRKWSQEGGRVSVYEVRDVARELMRRERYKHAFEVLKWMEGEERFNLSEADRAMRLELTVKVATLEEAEDYFAKLPHIASRNRSYIHLLNAYVKEKAVEKAESLMKKMYGYGAHVTPHPFNAMMKLYIATSQFDLVFSVISQMERNKIPRNVLSYNLWMTACNEVYGVKHVDMVYNEMKNDTNVKVGWSSLCTLANIYMKSGFVEKATLALRTAENMLSSYNHMGYFFLITNYASLKDKEGVLRVWEACKRVDRKLTCANYMCILRCLVTFKDFKEAEKIFVEWESRCRKYDVRVSNVLLGGYVRNGLMEKAEGLHYRTLEKGGCPNYKTWEILMEGYVKNEDMVKAVYAMKNGFKMLTKCKWKPDPVIVESMLEYFEKNGNLEEAMELLQMLRDLNLASLSVYRTLIKMRVAKQEPFSDDVKLMEDDKIDMDDDTKTLVQASQISALS